MTAFPTSSVSTASVLAVVLVVLVVATAVTFALGLVAFVGKGRLYERWLRWQIARGHVEEAIAFYKSRSRFDEVVPLLVSLGDVEGAARLYTKMGRPVAAAEVFAQSGDFASAAAHYVHAHEPVRAADCYRRLGDLERAVRTLAEAGEARAAAGLLVEMGASERAARLLEDAGLFAEAAEAVLATGDRERAGDLYVRAELPELALEAFRAAGAVRKAAAALELLGRGEEGARLLLEARQPLLAAGLLARAGRYRDAAGLYQASGAPTKAAEALVQAGDFRAAASLYRAAGEAERAATLLERAGAPKEAAEVRAEAADRAGEHLQAAESYLRLGRADDAVERFLRAGHPERAAEVLARLGRRAEAAEHLVAAQRFVEAAQLYVDLGDSAKAGTCLLRAGRLPEAVRQLRKAGDFLTIARVFYKLGERDRAAAVLREVPRDAPSFVLAAQMLARLLEQAGDLEGAKAALEACLEVAGLGPQTIDFAVRIAELEGRLGQTEAAVGRLDQLRAEGGAPPEVEEQLRLYADSLRAASTRPPAAPLLAPGGPALGPPLFPPGGPDSGPLRSATLTMGFASLGGGRYRFLEKIGAGSYGEVFRVLDTSLERVIAVKVLLTADLPSAAARHMFLREARLVAKLNHPNIITIYDIGEFGHSLYIAMELVEGENLADIMDRRRAPMPLRSVLTVARQACEALDYAHGQSIVHRDVKLENMMVAPNGRLKVLDFGLARILDDQPERALGMAGTPHYMAPELVTGSGFDGRTDIYALGVVLYCLTTARFPFHGENVLEQQRFESPDDPIMANPDLPRPMADVILRCLEKDPAYRFPRARDLLAEIQKI